MFLIPHVGNPSCILFGVCIVITIRCGGGVRIIRKPGGLGNGRTQQPASILSTLMSQLEAVAIRKQGKEVL